MIASMPRGDLSLLGTEPRLSGADSKLQTFLPGKHSKEYTPPKKQAMQRAMHEQPELMYVAESRRA